MRCVHVFNITFIKTCSDQEKIQTNKTHHIVRLTSITDIDLSLEFLASDIKAELFRNAYRLGNVVYKADFNQTDSQIM